MTIGRWIFAVVVIALVGVVAAGSIKPREQPPTQITTAVATKSSITRTVSGAGKLEPVKKVNVSANITGTLLELNVGVGSKVKKGDVLGQIDTSRYQAQTEQQEAQVRSAQADVRRAEANVQYLVGEEQRLKKMLTQGIATEAELAKARSSRVVAEAELAAAKSRDGMTRAGLKEARSALGWATLRAPIDGTVLGVGHRAGERIRGSDFAEDVVLVLGSLSEVDVRFEVGEYDVVHLRPEQPATIEIDAFADRVFSGKVIDSGRDAIVKNAGTENEVTTFPVWVTLEDPPERALPGMSAQVTISTETHNDVVTVPIQAVTVRAASDPSDGGPIDAKKKGKLDKLVFVVKDGVVEKRVVEVGLSSETHVEIKSGLEAGETIVEGPYRTLARELKDGMAVTTEEDPKTP